MTTLALPARRPAAEPAAAAGVRDRHRRLAGGDRHVRPAVRAGPRADRLVLRRRRPDLAARTRPRNHRSGPPSRLRRWSACSSLVGVEAAGPDLWSPYYRISTYDNEGRSVSARSGDAGQPAHVFVNGIGLQEMDSPTDPTSLDIHRQVHRWLPGRVFDRVLIIGAGTGNDAALALIEGSAHIDAVEIDPVIARLGRDFHPDRPYDDPRVTVHVDDGRAFLRRSTERYDLIVFAHDRLAHARHQHGQPAARVLPVHGGVAARGSGPSRRGRRLRDVQRLSPAMARRQAPGHGGDGVRPRAAALAGGQRRGR